MTIDIDHLSVEELVALNHRIVERAETTGDEVDAGDVHVHPAGIAVAGCDVDRLAVQARSMGRTDGRGLFPARVIPGA